MALRVNFNNPFRRKTARRNGLGTLETFDDYGTSLGVRDQNLAANNYNRMPGVKSIDPNALIGQLGKLYEEYGPSLQYMQKNPGTRGMVEAGLDYGLRSVPGYGQAYGAIQDFNRVTGGVNIGKAFGLKQDPFKALGNRIFGDPNKTQMTPAQLAIMGRAASRRAELENAASADIASARIERERLGGQQQNVIDLLADIAKNPLSSRDLAATVGAGISPLQELATKRAADTRAAIGQRGLQGGMATGLIEGTRQASDAAMADVINRTTLEAMARRPQMVQALAGVIGNEQARLDSRDLAARGLIGQLEQQDFQNRMTEENMQLERDRLAAARRASELEGLGGIIGNFGPDFLEELKRLRTRGQKPASPMTPLVTADTLAQTPDSSLSTFNVEPPPTDPIDFGKENQGQDVFGAASRIASPETKSGVFDLLAGQLGAVNVDTESRLMAQYPTAKEGFITPQSDRFGNRFIKTRKGWRKFKSPQTAKAMNPFADFGHNFGFGG
jgi:hypothetical protein